MDYTAFTAADFLKDANFQKWVLHPDPESIRFWETWLRQHPEKAGEVAKAKNALLLLQFKQHPPSPGASDRVWQKIRQARRQEEAVQVPLYPEQPAWWRQASRVAAMFGGFLLLAGLLSYFYLTRPITYSTAYGQIRTVVLPDASTVTLHANSSLRLARTWFGFQHREVWLEGEAYFAVQHTANHQRFVVHAGDRAQVEVLGTEFNVYHRERGARVVLNSGKVKLNLQPGQQPELPENTLVMEPGELVAVDPQSPGKFTKEVVDPALYSAWKENKLQFSRAPLAEVVRVLEEVYGLEVKLGEPALAQLLFTGSSPIDQPKLLLTALSKAFSLSLSQKENVLLIQAE